MSWIRDGYPIPLCKKVKWVTEKYREWLPNEKIEMSKAINKLIDLGAITECEPSRKQFISDIFLTPKPNGDSRFILNLKLFNKYVDKTHFKMEDYRTVALLISQGCFMATIDLKESYLLVPINDKHKKYLRFQFENDDCHTITYEFSSMPYGLSAAPRTFTKIMKVVVGYLRNRGFKSVVYLDDILCLGTSYKECLDNVTETRKILECLGFVINYEKSLLNPVTRCKYLGFVFDSVEMTISLPIEKQNYIFSLVQTYMSLPRVTIKEFAHLIGVLIAACPALRYSWMYTKMLEREKHLALLKCQNNYNTKFTPSANIQSELLWWKNNILISNNTLEKPTFALEIFSDASRQGWGAYCNDTRAGGKWKQHELDFHINYLELKASFLALKTFSRNVCNRAILLRCDNTTAISYLNRMGGIQFPHLNEIAREIWQWCEKRNIWLYASYINTKDNVEADQESRNKNIDTELELCNETFKEITDILGKPDIDLFASRANAKCERYISWKQDPDSITVDALTQNWRPYLFYAFPPFTLIAKCLQKIKTDHAEGILVFPYWPSQPWFPFLRDMCKSEILFFDANEHLVNFVYRRRQQFKLTLGVARLSGKPS